MWNKARTWRMAKDTSTGWGGAGGHSWNNNAEPGDGARMHAEFKAKQKRDHQAAVAARKAARDEARRIERENSGSVYGPPSPFAYRNGRPPLKG